MKLSTTDFESATRCAQGPQRDAALLDEMVQVVIPILHKCSERIIAAYVHGSFATRFQRPDSDIDFAVLSDEEIPLAESVRLAVQIGDALKHELSCDIAQLKNANTVFAAQVINSGLRIYAADESAMLAADHFEMVTLSKYARLNEERAGIVADIIKRGTVYGSENKTVSAFAWTI